MAGRLGKLPSSFPLLFFVVGHSFSTGWLVFWTGVTLRQDQDLHLPTALRCHNLVRQRAGEVPVPTMKLLLWPWQCQEA